jgi:hypothetical protein
MVFDEKVACRLDYKSKIQDNQKALKALGSATRQDIKDLFGGHEEKYTDEELVNLDYEAEEQKDHNSRHRLPLWKKMSVRFNNCKCDTATMWNQLDPGNRMKLLLRYKAMRFETRELQNYIMDFFLYISCHLADYSIKEMFDSEEMAEKWKQSTSISFYIGLDDYQKDTIIADYKNFLKQYM